MTAPLELFRAERQAAIEAKDPCAMLATMTTVTSAGEPAARMVVLHLGEGCLRVLASQLHEKWGQLQYQPVAEFVTWWPSRLIQYRLRCRATVAEASERNSLWRNLPEGHRITEHCYDEDYRPGTPDQGDLRERWAHRQAEGVPENPPEHSVAWVFAPFFVERIKSSPPDRLHDRTDYTLLLTDGEWVACSLIP